MRNVTVPGWLCLAALLLGPRGLAQEPAQGPAGSPGGSQDGPATAAHALPGFVWVPPGKIQPGCTMADYKARATNNDLKRALIYDVWGKLEPFDLPGFYIGRYEVTNAQWKAYLDREFRDEYVTNGTETLPMVAERVVRIRGKGVPAEWQAIYALNAERIVAAWKAQDEKNLKAIQEGKKERLWNPKWKLEDPPVDPEKNAYNISKFFLPKGLKLVVYHHRVPAHWYGWCRLSRLRVGREYVDASKAPSEAFVVPKTALFAELKPRPLRAEDFAAHPVRGVSPREMLDFAEWAGCALPSEYEFERAGRGDRPNTDQHTFPGPWKNQTDWRKFAWANNVACRYGPLPVDDPTVQGGDSVFCGARHLLGNVSELTRTFYDLHPDLEIDPPTPQPDLTNYALTAKGGNFGDRWQFIQLSSRTPTFGKKSWLDLKNDNRVDSLGLRLARHPQRGFDLMLHSILRLSYDAGNSVWNDPLPHAYAMPRMDGVDDVKLVPAESPYVHATQRAAGIAFAPLWMTDMGDTDRKRVDGQWRNAGKRLDGRTYFVLGALRSDVPLRVGRRLSRTDSAALEKARKDYQAAYRAWKQASKKKREAMKLPPKPPEPDLYEEATKKQIKQVGRWREATLPPGEWLVVYWYGFLGLANKALIMPPDGIVIIDKPRKNITRQRQPAQPARLTCEPDKDRVRLVFQVEEQPADKRKRQEPPREQESELWAVSEVLPGGWYGRKPSPYSWSFDITLNFEKGALAKRTWHEGKN